MHSPVTTAAEKVVSSIPNFDLHLQRGSSLIQNSVPQIISVKVECLGKTVGIQEKNTPRVNTTI